MISSIHFTLLCALTDFNIHILKAVGLRFFSNYVSFPFFCIEDFQSNVCEKVMISTLDSFFAYSKQVLNKPCEFVFSFHVVKVC